MLTRGRRLLEVDAFYELLAVFIQQNLKQMDRSARVSVGPMLAGVRNIELRAEGAQAV